MSGSIQPSNVGLIHLFKNKQMANKGSKVPKELNGPDSHWFGSKGPYFRNGGKVSKSDSAALKKMSTADLDSLKKQGNKKYKVAAKKETNLRAAKNSKSLKTGKYKMNKGGKMDMNSPNMYN